MVSSSDRTKRLLGVKATSALTALLKECGLGESGGDGEEDVLLRSQCDDDKHRGHLVTISKEEARSVLIRFRRRQEQQRNRATSETKISEKEAVAAGANDGGDFFPIEVLRSMQAVLSERRREELEDALGKTELAFSPATTTATEEENQDGSSLAEERRRFRKRMERLRYQQEENRYASLTKNVGTANVQDDEITTKSMTYAASIGLNMIVAPLSFGCLMYFFAGSLLDYIWSEDAENRRHHPNSPVDIKRVIAGVVSGVVMLFIEMILFVIRTHELDRAVRRKQRKQKPGPFGYYTSRTAKTYKEE